MIRQQLDLTARHDLNHRHTFDDMQQAIPALREQNTTWFASNVTLRIDTTAGTRTHFFSLSP